MGAAAEHDHNTNERTVVGRRDPLLGTLFDQRFRVDVKIAAGGFGAIYRATHLKSGHEFALKVLHANLTHDIRVVARFRREGVALTRLRDPHTITAYELGETPDGTLYIVMELLHGESLYERFRTQGPLPWPRVMAIARSVCSSLAEAHAHGIIHRDLKPTNIHLEPRGADSDYVKVLDFGIAKILHDSYTDSDIDASDLTQVGQMIGTLDYMSPEQMVGGPCTATTDIYTLGIVMYEMIAGHKPFEDANSAAAALASVLTTIPQPLTELMSVPPAVDRLVMKCLERQSSDRYQSAVELAMTLDDILQGRINVSASIAVKPVDEIPTAPVPTAVSVRPAPGAVQAAVEAQRTARASNQSISSPSERVPSRAPAPERAESPQSTPTVPHRASSSQIPPGADRAGSPPGAPRAPHRAPSPQIVPRTRQGSSPPAVQPGSERAATPQIMPRNRRGSSPQIPQAAPQPAAERPRASTPNIVAMPAPPGRASTSVAQLAPVASDRQPASAPRPAPAVATLAPSVPRPPPLDSHSAPVREASAVPVALSNDPPAGPMQALRLHTPPRRIPTTPGASSATSRSLREAYPTIHLQPPSAMRPPLSAFDDRPTTAINQLASSVTVRPVRRKVARRRLVYAIATAIALAIAATVIAANWY